MYDAVIIGAGPAGLAAAYAAKQAGLDYVVVERQCIVHTIYQFPTGLIFYSTPELISLGDVPMIVQGLKPTREEALNYYLKFVDSQGLKVNTYEEVTSISGKDGDFEIRSVSQREGARSYRTRKVVMATGAFDSANRIGVPGEELPKVFHYFKEGHPYFDRDVLVVGGKSSAVETALTLYRAGARVTMSYRRSAFRGIKYWVLPDLENRIAEGSITAIMDSTLKEIRQTEVVLEAAAGSERVIPNDFVFCMTGHGPDVPFLSGTGVEVEAENNIPVHDPDTFESNVPGIYIIGVITAGNVSSDIFIENSRMHGPKVVEHILAGSRSGMTKVRMIWFTLPSDYDNDNDEEYVSFGKDEIMPVYRRHTYGLSQTQMTYPSLFKFVTPNEITGPDDMEEQEVFKRFGPILTKEKFEEIMKGQVKNPKTYM